MMPALKTPDLEQDFRNSMASLAASVCVVTAGEGEDRLGRTVTAVFSLSVRPPTIMVSIAKSSDLAALILSQGTFSIAMLSEGQNPVADAFAGKLPPRDRFDIGIWTSWETGNPCLQDAVTSMDCEVTNQMTVQDHILFAGQARELVQGLDRAPLVWHDRRYGSVVSR